MILGKVTFILVSCAIEYVLINGVLDYFHDKKYGEEEKEYSNTMAYLQTIKKGGK